MSSRIMLFAVLLAVGMAVSLSACGTAVQKADSPTSEAEGSSELDFSLFPDVSISGADMSALSDAELSVLYQQARYCQAMVDADIETLSEIVAPDKIFTHMSGRRQTREEYFADIEDSRLRYFNIGIENAVVEIDGDYASVTYTSVLNANAYGSRGTYRIHGTHWYELEDGSWIACNAPEGTYTR